jgi:hypothetical protein
MSADERKWEDTCGKALQLLSSLPRPSDIYKAVKKQLTKQLLEEAGKAIDQDNTKDATILINTIKEVWMHKP